MATEKNSSHREEFHKLLIKYGRHLAPQNKQAVLEAYRIALRQQSKFKLGDGVEDTVTGFAGKVTAIHIIYDDVVQYEVSARTPDGGLKESWLPESRLKGVK